MVDHFDVVGAASLADQRSMRWAAHLRKNPHLMVCYRLLTRNPGVAKQAAMAIKALVDGLGERAVPESAPLPSVENGGAR